MAETGIEERTEKVVSPVLESLGMEFVDVEFRREQTGWVLRLYIDKEGGITLDDCSRVGRELGTLLDIESYIDRSYSLEVSSPGLTRPLKKLKDFEKFIDHPAKIKLYSATNGKKSFLATIKGVDGDEINLDIDGEEKKIKISDIAKANLEFIQEG
ncbi:MAG: ribosome maturation factor RimP [Proteobacteria bacterium]|nr:ribosome maturation factor RimP [Pseudomonadota bacterium]